MEIFSRWNELKKSGEFEQEKCELAQTTLLTKLLVPRTVKDALASNVAMLSTIRKYMGDEATKDALIETIAYAAGLLNIGKNLQPHQIEFLADEILRDWYWLKLSEIKFVMMEGVRGNYGQIYDCLDFRTVMEWLGKYDEQRTEIVERDSQRAHIEAKSENVKPMPMPKEVSALADKLKHPFDRELPEFEPDEFFEKMVKDEWGAKPESERKGTFETFRFLRIQQVKNSFRK